jgi:hypothetical protein
MNGLIYKDESYRSLALASRFTKRKSVDFSTGGQSHSFTVPRVIISIVGTDPSRRYRLGLLVNFGHYPETRLGTDHVCFVGRNLARDWEVARIDLAAIFQIDRAESAA